jgi:hypothetical protein
MLLNGGMVGEYKETTDRQKLSASNVDYARHAIAFRIRNTPGISSDGGAVG